VFEYSRKSRKKIMGEINVVPYIDVMLVLLVIFMVTTPLLTAGVEVDLPDAQAEATPDQDSDPFMVTVDRQGLMYVNDDKQSADLPEVTRKAASVLKHRPKTQFLVRGDKLVEYQHVMHAMVLLQQAGVPKVGLVTEPPEEK